MSSDELKAVVFIVMLVIAYGLGYINFFGKDGP